MRNKWKGERGKLYAIEFIKQFIIRNDRSPNSKDKGMGGIDDAIRRGEWPEFSTFYNLVSDVSKIIND
ncbi:MAG: hypothetical protein INQ03_02305 [Candidatus Heimdallarchaeota archaeon]|nr:hypothetical protein [Candidatus Heimdallarchaeota archaeon]